MRKVITKKQLQLGILFFTLFIDMVGFGIVIPVLPRYGEHFGATPGQIGLLVGIFSLAQLLMQPFWGALSDRIGRKPVLIVSVVGTTIGYFIMGWGHSILMMMLGRVIDGAAGGNMSTIQAYVSDITQPEERAQAMGSLGAAFGLGFIIGPALGGWAALHYGFSAPMFIAGGLALINVFLVAFFLPKSTASKEVLAKNLSWRLFWKYLDKRVYLSVLATFFFMIIGFSIMTTLFALFVYYRYGMNEQQTGYMYTMVGVIAVVVEGGLFKFLSKGIGNRRLIIGGALLLMSSLFLLPLTHQLGGAIFLCAMMAFGDSLMTPALPSIVSCSVKQEFLGSAFGFYHAVGSLARFLGPSLAGFLLAFDLQKPKESYAQTAFWIAAIFVFFSLLTALQLPRLKHIND